MHDLPHDACPGCGGSLDDTGEFAEYAFEDVPPPKVEVHRYRRRRQRCAERRAEHRHPAERVRRNVGQPEGALKDFNEQQIRDLFADLRSTQPLATR